MRGYYTIDENHVVSPTDLNGFTALYGNPKKRQVALDLLEIGDASTVRVSTVFLGLDHGYGGGLPILFETMVFGGKLDENQWRYSTYQEAVEGHARVLREVKEAK